MLDICLLGTGGMMPLPNRWLTSLLVRCDGKMMLIDCGEGTQIPLKMAGWGFKAIDALCFTHYHADHIAGLPGLLLTIGNSGREEPLILAGPPGLQIVVKMLTIIAPRLPFELRYFELPDNEQVEMELGSFLVKSIPVDHWIPCFSYSIEVKRAGKFDAERAKEQNIPVSWWKFLQKGEQVTFEGRLVTPEMVLGEPRKGLKVCYCTDTRPTDALTEFVRDSDLLICEGMYGEEDKYQKALEKKHMLFSEAAKLAAEGDVKELWLTHYSPSMANPEEHLENAARIFPNSLAGRDLMTRTLKFQE